MKKNDSKVISGETLRLMIISGGNNLFNHYPEIDALNVFPVPDGDTGTNMNLTMTSGSKEVANLRDASISEISKIFSRGLLMGARGNSGVILSQIFRGFSKALDGKSEANINDFAEAWKRGAETAYKAIMKPVEGTILTVIRESSEALYSKVATEEIGLVEAMELLTKQAQAALSHTPDLLPVLKEVGVVDSGGAGLCKIFEGMLSGLKGKIIERKQISISHNHDIEQASEAPSDYKVKIILHITSATGKKNFAEDLYRKNLEAIGKDVDIVVVNDMVKVTMIAAKPGMVLNTSQNYGELVNIEVANENAEEVDESIFDLTKKKDLAIIVTSVGKGLDDLFKGLNVDYIVSGGQTMNPSTEDFIEAIKKVNAEKVVILPNNKNILMAAQQAAEVTTDCVVKVVPSKTILQGISAVMMANPSDDIDTIVNDMTQALGNVKSGQVTFSIKDTKIDDVVIKKNYFMGLFDGKIVCCLKDKHKSAKELISMMVDDSSEILTLIYGEDVTANEAADLASFIEQTYGIEVEIHYGGQPVYSYLIGVE